MKKRWIMMLLCTGMLIETVIPVKAAMQQPESVVSANLPEENVLMHNEGESLVGLNNRLSQSLQELLEQRTIYALVYLCDSYELKQEPDKGALGIVTVQSGQTVTIRDAEITPNGEIWYKVNTYEGEQEYAGYIEREYLAYSDEVFIAWEQQAIAPEITVTTMEAARASQDIAQFPDSYQAALQAIKNSHPNWTFVRMNTGLDWNTVISNEVGERSLVPASSPDLWKEGKYSSSWYYATEGIIKYYMDPRNFLNESSIFQFEQLTYNASYHTQSAVQAILSNTFMAGGIPGDSRTYAAAFWEIGNNLGVSPFHLACRVYQEQGKGTSAIISGTYGGYEGLYNYFNIGASGSTDRDIITSGLKKAQTEGWTSRYASLAGGARIISENYILKGQDTLYLQKFDVDSSYKGLYWHQYMQNICAPESEGRNIRKAYVDTGSLNNTFVFKIPVYENMPTTACAKPGEKPAADITQIQEFVKRLYRLSLGREADANGLSYWTQELAEGRKTGAEVAKGFILSQEMNNRKLSDEQFVVTLYQTFFNRTPASGDSGKAFWKNLLANGVSRAYVFRGFCHSEEFASICGSYGINRGNITLTENRDQKHNLTMYVYRCYDRTLGRQPDVNGLNYWTGQLLDKQRTASSVAANFVFSKEFISKKYSDEEYVKIMYRMFFDREYDNAGFKFWVNELKTGNRDRYGVFNGFANSKEFKAVLQTFGL